MKSFAVAVFLLLGLSAVLAGRPKSEQVLEEVEKLRPRYQEIQDFVIRTISDARLSSSATLAKFHSDIVQVKTTFVVDAIKKENALLYQTNNQPASVDQNCLIFVRGLGDMVMNLAGTGFSTCIADASDGLEKKINEFYAQLQQDEKDYIGLGLLNVFKGENIFYTPDVLLAKLKARYEAMEDYPTYLSEDLARIINALGTDLESLEVKYVVCMTETEQRLRDGFILAHSHLEATCKASQVPAASNPEPEELSVAESMPSLPSSWPNTEAVRLLRERLGL
nr:uncharacterized protein LOC109623155 [Aedes albopictus]